MGVVSCLAETVGPGSLGNKESLGVLGGDVCALVSGNLAREFVSKDDVRLATLFSMDETPGVVEERR